MTTTTIGASGAFPLTQFQGNDIPKWMGVAGVEGSYNGDMQRITTYFEKIRSGELIASGAITEGKIATGAVTVSKIADNAVGVNALAENSVGIKALTPGGVTTVAIADGAVGVSKIADGAVGTTKIADNAVGVNALAAGSVGIKALAAGGVTSTAIASGAVTTSKIADGAVTYSQMASDSVGVSTLKENSVGVKALAPGGVTSTAIASAAVTSTKIDPESIHVMRRILTVKTSRTVPAGGTIVWETPSVPSGYAYAGTISRHARFTASVFGNRVTALNVGNDVSLSAGMTLLEVAFIRGLKLETETFESN